MSILMEKRKKQRVLCAMSGGVDSSVAAALLQERKDFEVIGVFMKFWSGPGNDSSKEARNRCCSLEAEKRARSVALKLKIPFYVLNFEKEFKKRIVDDFLAGYKKGITPNPCVICNKEIKFGLLLSKARQLGADFIATGHYARIRDSKEGAKLIRARDKNKDQSYFLWKLNQEQLKHILFPVGGYMKNEVRKMAERFKFQFSNVAESQEICFIKTTTRDFLKESLGAKKGKIVNTKGKIIGDHQGLWLYTIGQRKGIELSQGPFYVLDKNLKKNFLVVTKDKKKLYKKEVSLKNFNWILKAPKFPLLLKAKIRYGHKAAEAMLKKTKTKRYKLSFKTAQRAVTPGQSAVFYKRDEVLGGALIA